MDARAARARRRKVAATRTTNTGNPENPAVPLDPDAWEERGWLTRTDAGVRMNHRQAIGHPPIMRAINLIARGTAKLPANVYKLGANGDDSQIDQQHAAQYLIAKKSNPSMRAYTWRTSMMYHAAMRGNGYSAIFREGPKPTALVLLDPIKTEPFWRGSDLWYATEAGGEKRKIPAADVFHIKGLSFDGITGHDVLTVMANALGMGPAGRKWMSKLLSRGSTAGGLLQLPRELSPEARKKRQEEFEKYQSGLDNAFKTLALEDGAKWTRTMITPQEAAIFEVLGFDLKMVANAFGLPPHKLGDTSKASYNSLEQENKSFLDDSLDPWCIEFETEASDKLLTEEENRSNSHAIYIDRTAMQLGDTKSQADAFGKLTNDGLMLADEARARMNLPPLPNGQGKKLRIPVNIAVDGVIAGQAAGATGASPVPAKSTTDTPAAPEKNAAMQNAARELLADRLRRLEKIAAEQLPKAANKGGAAVADFSRHHAERLREALAPILPVVALANGLVACCHTPDEIAVMLVDPEQIGLAPPVPRTLDQQIAEVLRMVTTPKEPSPC